MTPDRDGPPGPEHTLPWLRQGTEVFRAALAGYDADGVRGPSRLPGWSVAHVAAHVARNADALGRLVSWAATGRETPMYAGPEQRATEIEAGAARPAAELAADVHQAARRLDQALAELSADRWAAEVRTAKGRLVPATQIPWLRVREVWLHAVDIGADPESWPTALVDAVLADALRLQAANPAAPVLAVQPTDQPTRSTDGRATPVTVEGPVLELMLWVTGRGTGTALATTGELPALPPYL